MIKARRRTGRGETARWADLPEEDLLELPLKSLKVRIDGTWLADCLRDEGIGPDHSLKFDIPADIIAMAKVRQPAAESLFTKSPAG